MSGLKIRAIHLAQNNPNRLVMGYTWGRLISFHSDDELECKEFPNGLVLKSSGPTLSWRNVWRILSEKLKDRDILDLGCVVEVEGQNPQLQVFF